MGLKTGGALTCVVCIWMSEVGSYRHGRARASFFIVDGGAWINLVSKDFCHERREWMSVTPAQQPRRVSVPVVPETILLFEIATPVPRAWALLRLQISWLAKAQHLPHSCVGDALRLEPPLQDAPTPNLDLHSGS